MKDAQGHGSDQRGARFMYAAKTFLWNAVGGRSVSDRIAAHALAYGGPKSATVPVHDAMNDTTARRAAFLERLDL